VLVGDFNLVRWVKDRLGDYRHIEDFNLVRWVKDRLGDYRHIDLMDTFNDFIRDHALRDVPLENKCYTWSNKRPQPVFSKIDRCLLTEQWGTYFSNMELRALEMIVSDHPHFILNYKQQQMRPRTTRLEIFWLRYEEADQIMARVW
jgi:hypothetical protein